MDPLKIDLSQGVKKSLELDGRTIEYLALEDLDYCTNPQDEIQKLNIFIPAAYLEGKEIGGYTADSAPIFMPNTVGGYMPGPRDEPGIDFKGNINSIFRALEHGYIVASAGVRGRTSGKKSDEFFEGSILKEGASASGKLCGKAPAFAVDMKAAIRFLRHNQDILPGDPEKIIVSGTSAGGALAALTGASGNEADYEPYLKEIGAAHERDDVFAASCYCPIHNLENADTAYEWLFEKEPVWHRTKKIHTEEGLKRVADVGELTRIQKLVSHELARQFPAYVNSLNLKDDDGKPLVLDEQGQGTFKDYVAQQVLKSAAKEKRDHQTQLQRGQWMVPGSEVEEQAYLLDDGTLDFDGFTAAITRMKPAPAFDDLDCRSPENEEFGTPEIPYQHFTKTAAAYDEKKRPVADEKIIEMMNPLSYIGNNGTAKHWRIRHGSYDRDTSLAIPVILERVLANKGYDVDFFLPWGMPHSGDYDLDELFAWIDQRALPA